MVLPEQLIHKLKVSKLKFLLLKHKTSFAAILIFAILTFAVVFWARPFSSDVAPIDIMKYKITQQGLTPANTYATLRVVDKGKLFIHPGERAPLVASITFTEDMDIKLLLGLAQLNKDCLSIPTAGQIRYSVVWPNGQDTFVADRNTSKAFNLTLKKDQTVTVTADKYGVSTCDWGLVTVTTQEQSPLLNYLVIFTVWALVFVLLSKCRQIFSATIGYGLFVLAVAAETSSNGSLLFVHGLAYSTLVSGFAVLFACLSQSINNKCKPYGNILLALLFWFPPFALLSAIYAYTNAGDIPITLDNEVFYAVFQTNITEAYEFVGGVLGSSYIVPVLISVFLLSCLANWQARVDTQKLKPWTMLIGVLLFSYALYMASPGLRVFHLARMAYDQYQMELKKFREVQEKRKIGELIIDAKKKSAGETHVVVIGESLNRNHMGLYGYHRNTTPFMDKYYEAGELMRFDNAYSIHTHTMHVFSHAFTSVNQWNDKEFYTEPSLVDILQEANLDVYWISNQATYGAWDNLVTLLAKSADEAYRQNKSIGKTLSTQHHDETVLQPLKKILEEESPGNRIIVIHLIGSHLMYCSRFPDDFNVFTNELEIENFGNVALDPNNSTRINCYDNSVLYGDYVFSEILELLNGQQGVNSLVFMPDHSEDPISGVHHDSKRFTYEMTKIPMLMWFSEDYKKRYPEKVSALEENKTTIFPNDLFFDTVLGLLDIESSYYVPENDLSSTKYLVRPLIDYSTLHGRKKFFKPANRLQYQQMNLREILTGTPTGKFLPARVNTIGKLENVLADGFYSAAVDVFFREPGGYFQIGNNKKAMTALSFEKWLDYAKGNRLKKFKLKIKNISEKNIGRVLRRLESLDIKYNLKERAIIEIPLISSAISSIASAGFYVSCVLPMEEISSFEKASDAAGLLHLSINIIEQLREAMATSMSFSESAYLFVKEYIEPSLDINIEYNIENLAIGYDSPSLTKEMKKKPYLSDPKVETITYTYHSRFEY